MKGNPEERAVQLGDYIVTHNTTVRATATAFGVSKSTVHKDITHRLPRLNRDLAEKVHAVLDKNKNERHLRGGLATREKYRMAHQDSTKERT